MLTNAKLNTTRTNTRLTPTQISNVFRLQAQHQLSAKSKAKRDKQATHKDTHKEDTHKDKKEAFNKKETSKWLLDCRHTNRLVSNL